MDEEQHEHESVARIQTRLKSGGKPPPKKKRKERRRNKRNKKSSEGCQIKRRKAKKMFPWMFMPGIESGRSRRRRESSSDSRRRRRDRRRRDRTGHPAAVVQRHPIPCQWQSQGTVGAKSRRRSFMEEQGLLWPRPRFPLLQRPLFSNGLNNSAEPKWRPPAHGSRSLGSHPRKPETWSERGSGSSGKWKQGWGQQREKGWNTKKDEGRDWAKPDPSANCLGRRSLPSGGGHKGRD